jgi:hypothetical protein
MPIVTNIHALGGFYIIPHKAPIGKCGTIRQRVNLKCQGERRRMVVVTKNDAHYLDAAIEKVTGVLTQKRQDWATGMEVFECFDAQKDFGDDPLEFAVKMCNLKMTRLKSCVARKKNGVLTPVGEAAHEKDYEDTIKDLAGYALLAYGMFLREQGRKAHQHELDVPNKGTHLNYEEIERLKEEYSRAHSRKDQHRVIASH